jgi:hypothetical protein
MSEFPTVDNDVVSVAVAAVVAASKKRRRSKRGISALRAVKSKPSESINTVTALDSQPTTSEEDEGEVGYMDPDLLLSEKDKRGRNKFSTDQYRARRMAIFYFFTQVYGSPDESPDWKGRNGIVVQIRNHLLLPSTSELRNVCNAMRVIKAYEANGVKYNGEAEPRKEWEHYLIPTQSYQSQLIADLLEGEFGFSETTYFVNLYREEHGLTHVGRSTVYLTAKRLKPTVTKIKKRQQGSLDLESDWCKASHRWSAQILIMFRIPIVLPASWTVHGVPRHLSSLVVPQIDIECTQYWDESHKKQRIGMIKNGTNIEYRFPRDEDGKLDLINGRLSARGTELKMKYEKEARFSTGMCLRLDTDGKVVKDVHGRPLGDRLPIFEYTEQKIVSNSDFMSMLRLVVREAKLSKPKKPWLDDGRVDNAVYKGDPVGSLKGVTELSIAWLQEHKVNTVEEYFRFFYMKVGRRKNFVKAVKGMSMMKQLNAEAVAEQAIDGPPVVVDHRKSGVSVFCFLTTSTRL